MKKLLSLAILLTLLVNVANLTSFSYCKTGTCRTVSSRNNYCSTCAPSSTYRRTTANLNQFGRSFSIPSSRLDWITVRNIAWSELRPIINSGNPNYIYQTVSNLQKQRNTLASRSFFSRTVLEDNMLNIVDEKLKILRQYQISPNTSTEYQNDSVVFCSVIFSIFAATAFLACLVHVAS